MRRVTSMHELIHALEADGVACLRGPEVEPCDALSVVIEMMEYSRLAVDALIFDDRRQIDAISARVAKVAEGAGIVLAEHDVFVRIHHVVRAVFGSVAPDFPSAAANVIVAWGEKSGEGLAVTASEVERILRDGTVLADSLDAGGSRAAMEAAFVVKFLGMCGVGEDAGQTLRVLGALIPEWLRRLGQRSSERGKTER
ncbi:MAG: hypothetical protein VR70_10715 [Rhodospirillaceae bacterium BRH_c57]|nr:MAG: hypothetical protein VR70_10715 [Rhodospirillaceae bacterium BRH_c57]